MRFSGFLRTLISSKLISYAAYAVKVLGLRRPFKVFAEGEDEVVDGAVEDIHRSPDILEIC